jgi:hypothetical protein
MTERSQRDTVFWYAALPCGILDSVWRAEGRTERMEVHMQMAEAVRQACLAAALQAYEDAGLSGLCHEGRWECAVDAIRAMPLRPLVHALLHATEHEAGRGHAS